MSNHASSSTPALPAVTASHDVIIVGGGVVGSALSYSLARSGRDVAMIERDLTEPDRIVGELLQPGGVRALKLMGLEDCLEGIDAVPVHGYHVFHGTRSVPIPYPDETPETAAKGIKSTSGRVEGRSFHHGRFVQALRKRAMAQEGVTTYEATVRELTEAPGDEGRIVGISGTMKSDGPGSEPAELRLTAPLTIVADGCFSKFRRTHGSSITPVVRSNFVALELKHAPLPSPNHGHVVLGPSGPTLLYQISSEHTRILMDVAGERLPSVAKGQLQAHIRDNVIPHVPEQLRDCIRKELDSAQRLRSMPNSFLPPSMQGQNDARKGVILVGDAMNMRHPLTGGGMTCGLWDAVHLTAILGGGEWSPQTEPVRYENDKKDLADWDSLKPAFKQWHWRRKGLSSVINILAQALYSLFGADDEYLEVLREGCFKYFELGGECVAGPVSLLSGVAPAPMTLFYHFFSVALYSIYSLFMHERYFPAEDRTRKPSVLEYPGMVLKSVLVFYTACVVLLPVVFTEMRSNRPTFKRKTPTQPFASLANVASSAVACASATIAFKPKSHPNSTSSSPVTVSSSSSVSSTTAASAKALHASKRKMRAHRRRSEEDGAFNNTVLLCLVAASAAYLYSSSTAGSDAVSILPRAVAYSTMPNAVAERAQALFV